MAYSSRDRVAQTEQQARAAQNNVSSYVQQRLAYQQTPPENRRPDVAQLRQYADDDFYKWVRSTYGFATKPNDIRNGYIDPSEDMVAKALSQYAYNRTRVSKQGKNPLKYGTLDYDPWDKDEADNEDWGAFVRDYERTPSETEFQGLRNQRAAKLQGVDSMSPSTAAWNWKEQYTYDQNDANDRARQKLNAAGYNVMPKALLAEYTNDPEDQRRLKAGLPPLRIERTQQIVDEVQRYKAEAQGLANSGQYTPEAAAMLRAKYPALNALQSEVEAAQESESGPTLKSMFDQTADPASRYFKTDVLAKYGYQPGSGFAFNFSNNASRPADDATAAQVTQGWKDAMQQRTAQQMPQPVAQPPQQSAVNPLTIPGGMSQLRGNEREGMGNAYQQANPQPVQQPSTLDNVLTGVSRVLNAPQALYLNAWNAAANAVQGRPVQYNPDISGAQYAAERAEAAGAPGANIPAALASIYTNDQTKAATAKALGLPEDSAAADVVTNIQSAGAQLPYEAATDPTTLFGLGEIAAISRGGRALQLGDAGYDAALAAGRIRPQDAIPTASRVDPEDMIPAANRRPAADAQPLLQKPIPRALRDATAPAKPLQAVDQIELKPPAPILPRALRDATAGPVAPFKPMAGNDTSNALQSATRAVDAPQAATPRNMAQAADDVAELTIDPKTGKPMPVGKPGQKAFDAQIAPPDGMNERGISRNIRTDANSPDALRESYSADPDFYKVVNNKDTLAKAQKIYDQGEAAARFELARLNERMAPESIPLAKMLARDAARRGDVALARQIMSDTAERLTTAGQIGQAAKILRDADPETMFMTMDKRFKKLNAEGVKVYGTKRWKDFDLLPEEIDEISKLTPGDTGAYEAVMEKIQARVADQLPSTAMEKLTEWRHMAMLLNPKTHLRNLFGNTLQLGLNKAAEKVDAVLQTAFLPKDLRTQSIRVSKEARQTAKAFFESNQKDLLTRASKYDEGLGLNMPNKRIFAHGKTGAMEALRRKNYDLMNEVDRRFYRKAFTDRLASAMSAKGVKSADGITDDMVRLAKKEAEKATFQDSSKVYEAIAKLKHSKGGVFVDTVIPFAKTPINITRRGLDYSPAGVAKGVAKLLKKETAAEGIGDIAKGLTGTGAMIAGYYMAEAGWLTGAADKDKDMRNYDAATGNAPFSIMGQYTYDWAQPAAIPLAVGVAIHDALQDDPRALAKMRRAIENGDTETLNQLAGVYGAALMDGLAASGDTIFNMSVLQGIQDLFSDPSGITATLAKMPASYLNQMVPTVSGQLAGTIDPVVRKTYYGESTPADFAKTQAAKLGAKIPGVSMLLEPKITPFGEEQQRVQNPWGRALQNFLSPGNLTAKQQIDPQIDTELRRLFDAGQVKQFPITVDRNFEFMDKQVRLTDTEYTRYQRVTGQETMKTMKEVLNSTEYREMPKKELESRLKALAGERGTDIKAQRTEETIKRLTDEYRAALMAKAIVYGRAMAQVQILQERGVLGTPKPKELAKRMPSITEADAKKLLGK